MFEEALLRGITWNHSRALPPLVAVAQRFEETHDGVRIRWDKRSLDEFGHAGLEPLCREYDLLVIDHPMLGSAAAAGVLRPLDDLVCHDLLRELSSNSVGPSFESYRHDGHLWALPIDAAAPCASYRPDLLQRAGLDLPGAWTDLLELARRGLVVMPGFPADVFLNFMGLYVSMGGCFDGSQESLLEEQLATDCLERLCELAACLPVQIYDWNPIAVYEHLASSPTHAYCPFAYSYSNYARQGFAPNPLRFAEPVRLDNGRPMRTILGGTGLAISTHCRAERIAAEFASFCASGNCQRGIYAFAGGQPAHRQAWLDPALNSLANGFFSDTLACLDRSVIRPRYAGYTAFQAAAGRPLVAFLRQGGSARDTIASVNRLYRQSHSQP